MARTGVINSATSQFFINTGDNTSFDHRGVTPDEYGYAVFGRVTAGMGVVDKIDRVKTGAGDVPSVPVTITGVTLKAPQGK
jgi:cyclophilin family peptidyl-prolyl cis-trans isomerase